MNAIVWLYRGEIDKYSALLDEYRTALGSDKPFVEQVHELSEKAKAFRVEAKKEVEAAAKREKKKTQEAYDTKLADLTDMLTIAKEANWLYEKFGDGVYADVLGLCKLASISEIEEKGWSLTPGAYVGVAPVKDDGVDFEERMTEIHRELLSLQAESNDLMNAISQNMKEMGL